jgi:hypothetical protein
VTSNRHSKALETSIDRETSYRHPKSSVKPFFHFSEFQEELFSPAETLQKNFIITGSDSILVGVHHRRQIPQRLTITTP